MSIAAELLPISEVAEPGDAEGVAELIRNSREAQRPVYPIGGGTALDFGLPAKRTGIGLSLAGLDRIVDYPARDLTITVESGVRLKTLAEALAGERQRLPFDVPHFDQATLGGIVATGFNGPLQFSQGGVRDHVIGIQAVDGRGMPFSGGGRVVKNVAGYDFCKLLTGSLGTLGVITQLTLKLKPQPATSALLVCQPADLNEAESLLAALVDSRTTPATIELLGGPAWSDVRATQPVAGSSGSDLLLAVALEGSSTEVSWMCEQLAAEWQALGQTPHRSSDDAASELREACVTFPAGEAQLVVQFDVVASHTTRCIAAARKIDEHCSFQAHAGNGVVIVRFAEFPAEGLARTIVGQLQPAARAGQGSVVVLANPSGNELTRQSLWGGSETPYWLMDAVKRQFDPDNLLNPDRFVYSPISD